MKQYLQLLKDIKEKGTYKAPAREGMPGTTSLFGYQFRHNLQNGFPLLTTKKMFWKGVVIELLWFLKGDTNIKYLVDRGVNIWNEDAYNFFKKRRNDEYARLDSEMPNYTYEEFIEAIKDFNKLPTYETRDKSDNYTLGDCGYQYGKVWRKWQGYFKTSSSYDSYGSVWIDQILRTIQSLRKNPEGRRHIVTAVDPANEDNLALYWCHAMFQFNCRKLTEEQRVYWAINNARMHRNEFMFPDEIAGRTLNEQLNDNNIPKYYLDCQLYQRSADVFLGVPFNIASYALLTHIIAKICNMVPGEFIHTFGDVHIYDNHMDAVEEQLKREPKKLPILKIKDERNDWAAISNLDFNLIEMLDETDFELINYDPYPTIKAELSTGLKK